MGRQDRIVIVTGASKGIGRATALAFGRHGDRVIAVARSAALLEALVSEAGDLPGEIHAAPADITQRIAVEQVVAQTLDHFGRIDVLVNNAGVERVKPVEQVTDEDYDVTLDTSLKGTFYFVRAVVPVMKTQRGGMIINVSSTAGLRGFAEDAVYCAAKFGVAGLSDALDDELRSFGIRVCCIFPGATNTDLAKDTWSPPDDPYRPYFLQPEDVARAILFVANQPAQVAIESIVLRPTIEPPYSPTLPLDGTGK
jgi:NADP-dependent 3-hydroxy acid dehydrogenase YdfG